jgi:anti-anti-sigma regulatory factor
MPLHIRFERNVAVLSNLGRAMNDPRYTDAGREVGGLLDQGFRHFIIELRSVGETGPPLLGVLMTITRQIRQRGGDIVLAAPSRSMRRLLDEMQMEDFWDVFRDVGEAGQAFGPPENRAEPGA